MWSVSPSVDMLPFGVTIPASVPQRSEIPEGLTIHPVLLQYNIFQPELTASFSTYKPKYKFSKWGKNLKSSIKQNVKFIVYFNL
jgi:hypothetical protein